MPVHTADVWNWGRARTPRGVPSDDDLRLIAEFIPHIVFLVAADRSSLYLNCQGREYTGVTGDIRPGSAWLSMVHPEERAGAVAAWRTSMREGVSFRMDMRIRRADGVYRWHTCRAEPVREARGVGVKWVGTCTDAEEQKQAAAELVAAQRQAIESLSFLDTLLASAPVGLGLADCEGHYVRVNDHLAAMNGVPAADHAGRPIAEVVPQLWPQIEPIYRTVLDTGEPVVNREVSNDSAGEGQPRHWLTTCYPVRVGSELAGVGIVRVDITEREEHERHRNQLMRASIAAIAATVEIRDPYTAGHQRRVADVSAAIAATMGLDPDSVEGIWLAASIHDIGKIGIPSEILARSGPLAPVEFELVKTHARAGHDIVAGIDFPWPVPEMILQHHERLDGSGYPDGRGGDDIVIGARIIAVADTVEAMASHRPYRPALGLHSALDTLAAGRGTKYDTDVVDAFLAVVDAGTLAPSLHEWWGHPGRP